MELFVTKSTLASRYRRFASHPQVFWLSKMIFRIMVALGLMVACAAQNCFCKIEDGQQSAAVRWTSAGREQSKSAECQEHVCCTNLRRCGQSRTQS